jgi:hypothetical protein
MRKAVHKLGPVIPWRHRKVASPESIALGQWLWIPGSRKSAPRNDAAYDSNFKIAELESLVGWAKARSWRAVPTRTRPSVGTLRFAHPTMLPFDRNAL